MLINYQKYSCYCLAITYGNGREYIFKLCRFNFGYSYSDCEIENTDQYNCLDDNTDFNFNVINNHGFKDY